MLPALSSLDRLWILEEFICENFLLDADVLFVAFSLLFSLLLSITPSLSLPSDWLLKYENASSTFATSFDT